MMLAAVLDAEKVFEAAVDAELRLSNKEKAQYCSCSDPTDKLTDAPHVILSFSTPFQLLN